LLIQNKKSFWYFAQGSLSVARLALRQS